MSSHSPIRYLTHKEINKQKWDDCLARSANRLIYGYSFYLDHMATQWDALVLNDYEAVMPLTWKKKWGICYLYQPAFTQQLGIFSPSYSEELISSFIQVIRKHFRFVEIFLNFQNPGDSFWPKQNFILSLKNPYESICAGYTKDGSNNLRRSEKFTFQYSTWDNLNDAIELYKKTYGTRTKHIKEKDYSNFKQLCIYAQENKMVVIRKVTDEKDSLQALALLLKDDNRIYLLQSTTLPAGRSNEANYFLLNNIIREFSQKDIILDFEGSDIPGIAHFYKNFGAANQPYYYFRHNKLPWPLKALK